MAENEKLEFSYNDSPIKNKYRSNGKWNIVFFQSGNYINYDMTLVGILLEFKNLGWVSFNELPNSLGGEELWRYIVNHVKSDYINFLADGFYSNNWDGKETQKNQESLFARTDVDLIIGAGTSAGKSLYVAENTVNTFIVSATDAIASGFSVSRDDSGKINFNAHIDPNNYKRQIRIFYDIVKFQKVGVPYEDSKDGKIYSGIADLYEAARQKKFEIVECKTINDHPDETLIFNSLLTCFQYFADQKVDAVYFTEHGITKEHLKELANFLIAHKIPNFSQSGYHEVEIGFMLSFSHAGMIDVGKYTARKIAKTFNGANPRNLTQYYEDSPHVSINKTSMNKIGFIMNDFLKRAIDIEY